jgi:phage terminase large subunit
METHEIDFNPTNKQHEAWKILNDTTTNTLFYGGAASGGKTYLACCWLIINCLQYKGSRWFIGRDKLKSIYLSTFNTFVDICRNWKLYKDEAWSINQQSGIIKFYNGSEIILLDMHHNPADPNFDRLGSMEFTGGFLEEVAEIERKGYEIIKSRIRYKLDEFNLIPKLLIVSNPTKNWIYTDFYNPYKNGVLGEDKVFLSALPTDNPYTSSHYLKSLHSLNEVDKQRLLYGNFDYDDDDRVLCSFDKLCDCFTNDFVDKGERYIVTDLAMQGRDNFIVTIWDGLRCEFSIIKNKATGKEIEEDLLRISQKYNVPRSNICADSDGMGSYLSSYLTGIKEFHGGSSANNKEEYKNLKSECAFKLAELINSGSVYIKCNETIKSLILEELGQLKRDNIDKDEMKKHIIKKDEMKNNIGRSPDFLDCLIMRMVWLVRPQVICI